MAQKHESISLNSAENKTASFFEIKSAVSKLSMGVSVSGFFHVFLFFNIPPQTSEVIAGQHNDDGFRLQIQGGDRRSIVGSLSISQAIFGGFAIDNEQYETSLRQSQNIVLRVDTTQNTSE